VELFNTSAEKALSQSVAPYKREEFDTKNPKKRGEYGMSPPAKTQKTANPSRKAERNKSRPP
jgi:hypothetical protein